MLDRWKTSSGARVRPLLTSARTACKEPITGYYAPLDESYEGVLCTRCFTPEEIEAATEMHQAEDARAREEAARWEAERQESNERALRESRERVDRYKTGELTVPKKP